MGFWTKVDRLFVDSQTARWGFYSLVLGHTTGYWPKSGHLDPVRRQAARKLCCAQAAWPPYGRYLDTLLPLHICVAHAAHAWQPVIADPPAREASPNRLQSPRRQYQNSPRAKQKSLETAGAMLFTSQLPFISTKQLRSSCVRCSAQYRFILYQGILSGASVVTCKLCGHQYEVMCRMEGAAVRRYWFTNW